MMSPASSGALEVERYIGACLISSQQSRYKKHYLHQDVVYHQQVPHSTGYRHQQQQRCSNTGERWAGGMPLISYQRCWNNRTNHHQHEGSSPLSRLAVHTQGAPLILSNNKYRKNKARNNNAAKLENKKQEACRENSTDTVSVASDESSGSANSDTCLPRIIKPRKRRKKDRKPTPHLARPLSQDGSFSTDSASPDIDSLPIIPFVSPYAYEYPPFYPDSYDGDISETPKLHHSFEDVKESDSTDLNGNLESSCQCRYCDPCGQIWDIDRSCYSPFLTSPTFQFPSSPKRCSSPIPDFLIENLSTFTLDEDKPPRVARASSDLGVSTEIVTSLNGHRDIEIKFFSLNTSSIISSNDSDSSECFNKKCTM